MRCRGVALIELMLACALAVALGASRTASGGGADRRTAPAAAHDPHRAGTARRRRPDRARPASRRLGRGDAATAGAARGGRTSGAAQSLCRTGARPRSQRESALGHAYSRDIAEDGQVANHERFGLQWLPAEGLLEWRLSGSAAAAGCTRSLAGPGRSGAGAVTALAIDLIEERHSLLALCGAAAGGLRRPGGLPA